MPQDLFFYQQIGWNHANKDLIELPILKVQMPYHSNIKQDQGQSYYYDSINCRSKLRLLQDYDSLTKLIAKNVNGVKYISRKNGYA